MTVGAYVLLLVFLVFQPLDRITKESLLGFLDISLDEKNQLKFSLIVSWSLATNTISIIDLLLGLADWARQYLCFTRLVIICSVCSSERLGGNNFAV